MARDRNVNIKGDTVSVVGSHSPELKQGYTTLFTNTVYESIESYDDNKLCPRFLLGTPGCIGAGLDCVNVTLVSRLGLPTSIIHLIQEMGRCGRKDSTDSSKNEYCILFQLSDYTYLVERLYSTKRDDDTSNYNNGIDNMEHQNTILTKEEERSIQLQNIHTLCQFLFLNHGCWHRTLELMSGSPFISNEQYHYYYCNKACPFCDGSINEVVKRVDRKGLCRFLVNTLLINCVELFTPSQLAKKLLEYPSVGTKIYGRKTGQGCEKTSDPSVTILQLLSNNILCLNIKESNHPVAHVSVSFTDDEPNYTKDIYWSRINTFN